MFNINRHVLGPLFICSLLTTLTLDVSAQSKSAKGPSKTIATSCNGKVSIEPYIHSLSDYELMNIWMGLLANPKWQDIRSFNAAKVWVNEQPICDEWSEGTYIMEMRWVIQEISARNLIPAVDRIFSGSIAMKQGIVMEQVNGRWITWTPFLKNR